MCFSIPHLFFTAPVTKLFRISDFRWCSWGSLDPLYTAAASRCGPTEYAVPTDGHHAKWMARVAYPLQLLLQMFTDDTNSSPRINLSSSSIVDDANIVAGHIPHRVAYLEGASDIHIEVPILPQDIVGKSDNSYCITASLVNLPGTYIFILLFPLSIRIIPGAQTTW